MTHQDPEVLLLRAAPAGHPSLSCCWGSSSRVPSCLWAGSRPSALATAMGCSDCGVCSSELWFRCFQVSSSGELVARLWIIQSSHVTQFNPVSAPMKAKGSAFQWCEFIRAGSPWVKFSKQLFPKCDVADIEIPVSLYLCGTTAHCGNNVRDTGLEIILNLKILFLN